MESALNGNTLPMNETFCVSVCKGGKGSFFSSGSFLPTVGTSLPKMRLLNLSRSSKLNFFDCSGAVVTAFVVVTTEGSFGYGYGVVVVSKNEAV
ncbi:hypothetical protein WICPIJ_005639 [Wickerhamomyces pijperi]|uniref:Uncharacterized protein n=1 Tax=Wickerhamomyces pijperi TaxID=599730 RepID=A0A9P8TLT5_WICPI|nr:hypothetical protein WICPIJ_005639 [Wickerhamomyces pijperi]